MYVRELPMGASMSIEETLARLSALNVPLQTGQTLAN